MSHLHTVEKIGGTSISATEQVVDNVLIGGRQGPDLYQRIFVVSAFAGMTDKLLEHKKSGVPGVYARFIADEPEASWEDGLAEVSEAMRAKNAEILGGSLRQAADAFVEARIAAMQSALTDLDRLRSYGHFRVAEPLATVREMLASLGEAHSAFATTLLLQSRGVEAVFVDLTGWQESEPMSLDERIERGFAGIDLARQLPITTGYARCEVGMVSRYARGYSELTFSRIAVVTGAREAIIHKEFHLSSADPKLVGVGRARKIGRTNYDVADQLANLGMEAIHPFAGRGLRQADIPLRVRNTFDPADEGTLIEGGYRSATPRVEIVTGLRTVHALQVFAQDMVGEKGYDSAILEALERHDCWIVSKSSNANTITHYLSASSASVRAVIKELEKRFPDAAVSNQNVAMVAAIGSDLGEPGFVATALKALAAVDVTVVALQHQIRDVDIQLIVEPGDFEPAVKALHDSLVSGEEPGSDQVWPKAA